MYKVIFLDDEAITLQLLEHAIDWQKFPITLCGTATDGDEGLELFQKVEPDIVITDIRMPHMDGIAFTRAIRQTKKKVKILLLSAHAEFEYAQSAINYQISDYLLKPLDEDKLETAISRIVQELDRDKVLDTTVENYRVEQAERSLLHYLTQPREGSASPASSSAASLDPDPVHTLPTATLEILKNSDTFLHVVLLTDPTQLREVTGRDSLRVLLKSQLGPGTLAVPLGSFELVVLTRQELIANQLNNLLSSLDRQEQSVQVGSSRFDDAKFNLRQAARQAELAAYECFYTGAQFCPFSEEIAFSNQASRKFADFEYPIAQFVEQGKGSELWAMLHNRLDSMIRQRVEPGLLFDFVFEVLNWVKIEMVKRYGASSLTETPAVVVSRDRVRACGTRQDLFSYLENYIKTLSRVVESLLLADSDRYIVTQARDYTRKHFTEVEFTLQDVATYVGLSKNHFSSVFHTTTGQKFWDYVTQLRIDKAKEMLKQSNCSNSEISLAIGYESEFYFSKIFKKVVGVPAQQYRRK